jgi:hypothetical protein
MLALAGCVPYDQRYRAEQVGREESRRDLRHLTVVPAQSAPTGERELYYKGDQSTTAGASAGAQAGLEGAARVMPPIAVVTVPLGALLGAIYGAAVAVTPEQAAQAEAAVQAVLATLDPQVEFAELLRATIVQETGYTATLAAADGVPVSGDAPMEPAMAERAVIRSDVTMLGFQRAFGSDPEIRLLSQATLTLSGATGEPEEHRAYCASDPHRPDEWADNGAQVVAEAVRECLLSMARSLVLRTFSGAGFLVAGEDNCMLEMEPVGRTSAVGRVTGADVTLRWEAFPREIDRVASYADRLGRVTDVTYDLTILKAPASSNEGSLVAHWSSLPQASFQVQLAPSTPGETYAATVRARFTLDGHRRVTGWSRSSMCAGEFEFVDTPSNVQGFERFAVRPAAG